MRYDVLNLILGWTLIALMVPLAICGFLTLILDGWQLAATAFLPAVLISGGLGAALLGFFTRTDSSERLRDLEAFVGVGLVWPITVLIGAIPYWLGGVFVGPMTDGAGLVDMARGFANSWFESMSGFTTSGATVIAHNMSPNCIPGTTPDCINAQPQGLLLWRSLTQWLGGMGVVMLGMLVLSRIMGGGMALARAELTGPSLSRLRPKLRQTAIVLWSLYLLLTLVELLCLKFIGGMSFFDSVNHALTTMPSGGFSTRDASIGFYNSATIDTIIIVFMFLAGVNFTLIWLAGSGNIKQAFRDEEFRTYLWYIGIAVAIITITLVVANYAAGQSLRYTLFTVLSIGTSTGYSSTDYGTWPVLARLVLLILMIVGACAGSTSGGLKLMRIRLALKIAFRELSRIAQPRKVQMIRMNGEVVEQKQVGLIVGMLFIWVALFAVSVILLAFFMPDESFETIISVVAASLGNTGPALDAYGPSQTWASMDSGALFLTSILMWFGRLELLTAIIVLHPHSWRKEEKADGELQAMAMVKRIMADREDDEAQNKVA